MDPHTRGRSPSAGQQNSQHIRSSPSPHNFTTQVSSSTFEKDPSSQIYTSQPYPTDNLSPSAGGTLDYNLQSSYLDAGAQAQPFQQFGDSSFDQPFQQNGIISNGQQAQPTAQQPDQQYQADMLSVETGFGAFPHHQGFSKQQDFILDPQLQAAGQRHDQSINPADLMSNIPSPQHLTNTPPNVLNMNNQHSEPTSPFSQSAPQRPSPHHSRHSSLDPSAAVFPNGQQQQDWTGMMQGPQFQTHRRAPSEYSDVSSSAAPSPFLGQSDNFDPADQNPSPLLNPQQDQPLYTEGLGIENFNISDPQTMPSPRHSPYVSPLMSPQTGMMIGDPSSMQLPASRQSYNGGLMQEVYAKQEQFPSLPPEQRLPSNYHGQADQYDVPQINVESAPNTQQMSMANATSPSDMDALSPPERAGRNRGRNRSLSDTHVARSPSPSSIHSALGSTDGSMDRRALSPQFSPGNSRSPSPDPRGRRSSTSSIPNNNRDYILELAGDRPAAAGRPERVQKHPATFSCHLCPKKFTRAYNLRSHLRTHTDERPFVCTVCSKAFARQHDRKRHEGLHSGEKKFVCRGELGTGATWGCGRRFARADALGRHFRSEAGRVCIKPLLDEEALERQKMDEHLMQSMSGGMAPQAPMNGMPMQQPFAFPAALLQQFPALQGLQWDQLQNGPDDDAGDMSGRSSFDASSGGDFYDDEDGGSGYVSDNPMTYGQGGGWDHGWKSDIEP